MSKQLIIPNRKLFGPSAYPTADNIYIKFNTLPDLPDKTFTKMGVKTTLYTIDDKKAPGPNSIDFRILKLAQKILYL